MIRAITGNTFRKHVIDKREKAVVKFKNEWNGSCRIVAPIFKDIAEAYRNLISFYTVDIDNERTLADEYGIMEVPAILFFINGEVVENITGLTSKMILKEKIESAFINQK